MSRTTVTRRGALRILDAATLRTARASELRQEIADRLSQRRPVALPPPR